MRVVWKFPLTGENGTMVTLPRDSKVVKVALQARVLTAWVELIPPTRVNEEGETITEHDWENHDIWFFRVFGTGEEIPLDPGLNHFTTIFDGHFVWHVYAKHTMVRHD